MLYIQNCIQYSLLTNIKNYDIIFSEQEKDTPQTGKDMRMASKASLENALRAEILEVITNALSKHFDVDIITVGSGEISLPLTDAEGNEKYPKIKVSIPRGTRNGEGGYTPYDGYNAAEEYKLEQESKAQERAVRKAMKEAEKGKKKAEGE